MASKKVRKIYIVGHKNPDTDSICSAIAYANIKSQLDPERIYEPRRAGQVNQETQYVLKRFHMEIPKLMTDVGTQVKDIEIGKTPAVDGSISLKKAWTLMKELGVETLPIIKDKKLEGLITMGDITKSYMAVYDSAVLSKAHTKYKNILETLDGTMIVGNEHAYFAKGKVLIAAANPDLMENYIESDDLVILGNRYESQLCAIEMNASCIVVCEGAPISMTIKKLAEERCCVIVSTPHDTFTVARLINQSMPIKYFMCRENLIMFRSDDKIEEIRGIMASKRHREFPIIDKKGSYVGMISRRSLLNMRRKQLILVDHNEKTQAVDNVENAEILEIIDHHRLGSLETISPVFFRNQPVGCTATILYQIYKENRLTIPADIAGLLCSAIISDTLMYRSPTCTAEDKNAAEELAALAGIEIEEYAHQLFIEGSNLSGRSPEEIVYQDFKKFDVNDVSFGVGQVNLVNGEEISTVKEKLMSYLSEVYKDVDVDMMFIMLTDIMEESTELLFYGTNAKTVVQEAFTVEADENSCQLPGVVSRKKQLIPAFVSALQK